jgi:hypothetical protein
MCSLSGHCDLDTGICTCFEGHVGNVVREPRLPGVGLAGLTAGQHPPPGVVYGHPSLPPPLTNTTPPPPCLRSLSRAGSACETTDEIYQLTGGYGTYIARIYAEDVRAVPPGRRSCGMPAQLCDILCGVVVSNGGRGSVASLFALTPTSPLPPTHTPTHTPAAYSHGPYPSYNPPTDRVRRPGSQGTHRTSCQHRISTGRRKCREQGVGVGHVSTSSHGAHGIRRPPPPLSG